MDSFELLDEVIDLIKEEPVYLNYKKSLQNLEKEEVKTKLFDYQRLKELDFNYPTSFTKEELKQKELEISLIEEVKEYEKAYRELNQFLEEIKQLMFKGMVEDDE